MGVENKKLLKVIISIYSLFFLVIARTGLVDNLERNWLNEAHKAVSQSTVFFVHVVPKVSFRGARHKVK